MGSFISNFISAEQAIVPQVNNTFWSTFGMAFVNFGSWLLNLIATAVFALCKFALNIIDFMQFLVEKLAGLDAWMHLDSANLNNLKETDVVFRFLLSENVLKVFRAMIGVFFVLLILFTIIAIIKNEYGNATANEKDAVDHRKTFATALKSIMTVALVPILLIAGILTSNAILASIIKAFQLGDSVTIGSQIFIASAYDANTYRIYANDGTRKPVSNIVMFTDYEGNNQMVSSALTALKPSEEDTFYGYMFTFNGEDYYLWKTGNDESARKNYYNYIKYILGAAIVERNYGNYMNTSGDDAERRNYYATNGGASKVENSVETKAKSTWDARHSSYNIEDDGFINGYDLYRLNMGDFLLGPVYNTWSYNTALTDSISGWADNRASLKTQTLDNVVTGSGSTVKATYVTNNENWGKLHDGGEEGFSPLSVEYLVMADVIDFMIQNDVKIYFVNANNPNLRYNEGGPQDESTINSATLVYDFNDGNTREGLKGFLVSYKSLNQSIAYKIDYEAKSEVEGATYLVCLYDTTNNCYVPLVNNTRVFDERGQSFTFSSSQYSDGYRGVVIAHALFESSNTVKNAIPLYISQTIAANSSSSASNVVDTTVLTNAQTSVMEEKYSYARQLTNVTKDGLLLSSDAQAGEILVDSLNKQIIYFDTAMVTDAASIGTQTVNNFIAGTNTYTGFEGDPINGLKIKFTHIEKDEDDNDINTNYIINLTYKSDATGLEVEDVYAFVFDYEIEKEVETSADIALIGGYSGANYDGDIKCLYGNIYVFGDATLFNASEDKATATTNSIEAKLNAKYTILNATFEQLRTPTISGYNSEYSSTIVSKAKFVDESFAKIYSYITYNSAILVSGDAQSEDARFMYCLNIDNKVYNTYNLYYANNVSTSSSDTILAQNMSIADLEYSGTVTYTIGSESASFRQYKYSAEVAGKTETLEFNAAKIDGLNADDGFELLGIAKNGDIKAINGTDNKYVQKYDIIRVVKTNAYAFYDQNDLNTIYVVDVDNYIGADAKYYKATISGTTITSGEEYAQKRIGFETFAVDELQWLNYANYYPNYRVVVSTTTEQALTFVSSDVYIPTVGRLNDVDTIARLFTKNLMNLSVSGERYNGTDRISVPEESALASVVQDKVNNIAQNPISINFCRDVIDNAWIYGDIKLLMSWDPGFSWGFRFHMASLHYQSTENLTVSNGKTYASHNVVVALAGGSITEDYNFSATNGVVFGNAYQVAWINWIILIFSIVLVFGVLGTAVWGLIKRIYQITLLFLLMPAAASTMPLNLKNASFNTWKEEIIKEVLGAYGVTIGLNFVFMLFPVLRSASAIFTDADVESLSGAVRWFARSADRLNWFTYILFMLVAFTLIKTVPSFISKFVGGNDVVDSGSATKQAVAKTVTEVGNTVSGKNAKQAFNNFGNMMLGEKDKKTGKRQGGLLTPGLATFRSAQDIYNKYRKKPNKEDEEKKIQQDAENRANAAAEAKMKEGNKAILPKVDKEVAENVSNLANNANMQEFIKNEANGNYRDVAQKAFDDAKAKNKTDEEANATAMEAARNAAKTDLEALAKGEAVEAVKAENADESQHAAVADKLADQGKEQTNESKQYAEASKSYAEASKTYANIAGGKLDAYKRDISEINRDEKTAAAQQKADEAREKGKMAARLSEKDIDKWNEAHPDQRIAKKGDKEYGSEAQKQLRMQARMEKLQNKLENNVLDAERGIEHGLGASLKRKLVGGLKTETQRQKESEKAQQKQAELDKYNEIVKDLEEDGSNRQEISDRLKAEFGDKYVKKLDKIYAKKQNGKGVSNLEQNLDEARKEAISKFGTSLKNSADRAAKVAAEDKKGALLKTGRGISAGIKVAGGKVASGLRNSGLGSLVLGVSKTRVQAAEALLEDDKALSEKEIKLREERKQLSKEYFDLISKQRDIAKKYDQAKFVSEYRKIFGESKKAKSANDKKQLNAQLKNIINEANSSELFKGTNIEQFVNEASSHTPRWFINRLKKLDSPSSKGKKDYFNLNARKNNLNDIQTQSKAKYNEIQQKDKALANLDNKRHSVEELEKAKRLTNVENNYAFRIGLAKLIKRRITGTQGDIQAGAWNQLLGEQLKDLGGKTVKGGRVITGLATVGASELIRKGTAAGVKKYRKYQANKAVAQQAVAANYQQAKAERDARREANSAYIGQLILDKENATTKAMVNKLRKEINAGKFKGDSVDAKNLIRKYMAAYYNEENGTAVKLTEDEQKRLQKYISQHAAIKNVQRTNAQRSLDRQKDRAVSSMERRYANEINKLQREIDRVNANVSAAIKNRIDSANPRNSAELQRYIREELNREIRKKQAELLKGKSSAEISKLNAEIKSMKNIVSRATNANNAYKRDLRRLQEADRKMSKQLKNSKSQSALAQATKTSNSFGEGASGK